MKKIIATILSITMFCQVAMADCANAVLLRVGDTVKDCDRVGLSVPYEKNVRADLVEGDYNKKVIDEQNKIIQMKDLKFQTQAEQTKLYQDGFDQKSKELDSEKSRSHWEFYGGIGLGLALALIGVMAVNRAAR